MGDAGATGRACGRGDRRRISLRKYLHRSWGRGVLPQFAQVSGRLAAGRAAPAVDSRDADADDGDRLCGRLAVLYSPPGPAAGLSEEPGAAVPISPQQMVFRRDLRLDICAT